MQFKILLYLLLFILITQESQARGGHGGGRGGHGGRGHGSGSHSSSGSSGSVSHGSSGSSSYGSSGSSYGSSSHGRSGSSYGSSSHGSSGSSSYGNSGSSSHGSYGGGYESAGHGSSGSNYESGNYDSGSYGSKTYGSGGKSGSHSWDPWGNKDSGTTSGGTGSKYPSGDFDFGSPWGNKGSSSGTKYPWGDFDLPGVSGPSSRGVGGTKDPFDFGTYPGKSSGSSSGGIGGSRSKYPWGDFELPGMSGTSSMGGSRSKYPWGDLELPGMSGTSSMGGSRSKYPWGDLELPGMSGTSSRGGSRKNPMDDFDLSGTMWGNKASGTNNNHPPTTHKTEYKTQPSAPKFEDHKKTKSTQQSYDKPTPETPSAPKFEDHKKTELTQQSHEKPASDTPSAPSLGGGYGAYRRRYHHHAHNRAHGTDNSTTTTPQPYAPAALLNTTRFSPPYPTGTPEGLHPIPQNTGHSSYPQSAPYLQQVGYPVNTGGYHPSHPSGESSFSQPGVVYVPSAVSSSRGTGDIIKEALIHSTINAGVNAAANRIFNPSHYSGQNNAHATGVSGSGYNHTEITYNNYYNQLQNDSQGGASSAFGSSIGRPDNSGSGTISNVNYQAPSNQPSGINNGNVSPGVSANNGSNNLNVNNPNLKKTNINQPSSQPRISDEELRNLTEDIFSRQEIDVNKFIRLNLQKQVNSTNITDESPKPLFEVQPEINTIPSIELIKMLYDNYESNSQIKEKVSPEKTKEQNDFLEVIMQTNVMSGLMKWLTEKNYIAPDNLSKKEMLTRIWFSPIEGSTSAFERTFLAENYWNTSIMGFQNWIYFNHAESKKEVNYMGYMDKIDLGDRALLLKVVVKANEISQPTSIFVGTLPELEMALYTVCFYARPNELCPISLGGAKFNIFTHTFISWGKNLLDVAIPLL